MKKPIPTKNELRDAYLRKAYDGLTLDQWQKMYVIQHGKCAICLRPPKVKPLEVDHDHQTGRVRGLLCFTCNHRLLGRGLEHAWLHQKAVYYLNSQFDARYL